MTSPEKKSAACKCHIFSQRHNSQGRGFCNTSECWDKLEINENYVKLRSGAQQGKKQGSGGRRGCITEFSPGSRRRMIQKMASLRQYFSFWQDFTFSDDVMIGKTFSERLEISKRVLKSFKRWLDSEFYGKLVGIWRREWEPRKSGELKGHLVPHFHMLFDLPGITESDYKKICIRLAQMWVEITGTENSAAYKVALNGRSYRWLNNKKMAQIYVSKYVAKLEKSPVENGKTLSIGRCWGFIGKPEFSETESVTLTNKESVMIRRMFRKMSNSIRLRRLFRSQIAGGWLLMERKTVNRYLDYILDELFYKPPLNEDSGG